MHCSPLQGAFKILSQYSQSNSSVRTALQQLAWPENDSRQEDNLVHLFQALDIQTATYVLGSPPYLPA